MRETTIGLLGLLAGAALVFFVRSGNPSEHRYQHIGFEKMEPDDRIGFVTGMSEKVLDSQTGRIYQRMWGLHKAGVRFEERTTFIMLDPVGMTTNSETKVTFTTSM